MRKYLIALLFLIAPFSKSLASFDPVRYVQISTKTLSKQTGTFNVSGGTITNIGYNGSSTTFLGAGSTITVQGLFISNVINVTSGTVTTLNSTVATISSGTFLTVNTSSIQATSGTGLIYSNTGLFVASITGGGFFMRGTTTNDSAVVGWVGEYISSSSIVYGSVGTSTQYFDLASITLTAGDWDLSGVCYYRANGGTVVYNDCGIGTATGNSSTGLVDGDTSLEGPPSVAAYQTSLTIPGVRKSIAATTTYYLKGNVQYSVATPQFKGRISARRVR